ncbi:MAG: cytochrome b/b6 domain-containing protein [Desulfovibrionaceae bacterium]|jgi:thiosulfate reductase cytochrome b subunit|nr:cytochrome b/b6 domain-containing protein [Desulfovibrionaceae bacterium]
MSASNGGLRRIYLYSRFERFWHWFQGALIILLLLTGFELHGTYHLFGFEEAFAIHNGCAWTWGILYVFILFWMVTTGEWKQYTPRLKKILDVVRYYLVGIFRGEPHPVPKTERAKHNPLQRMTYLGIVTALLPFQMATGFFYYTYNRWPEWGLDWALEPVALLHTLGAFLVLQFLVVHVYMTSTGHSVFAHVGAMISGWEEVHAGEPDSHIPGEIHEPPKGRESSV